MLRRGGATTLALLLMLLMSVLGMGLASTTLEAMRLTHLQQRSSLAFHLAESGAERALRYLRVQSTPPTQTTAFQPFGASAIALGSGTYEVTIDPDDDNPNLSLKRYLIQSVGRALGRQETIELYVQMSTFGEYAFFFDRWPSGSYLDNNSVVDGPAHLNATDSVPINLRWSAAASNPIFQNGLLTTAASTINYLAPSTAPTTEEEHQKVFELGSAGYRLGVSSISLPACADDQKHSAWGASSGFPTTSGVSVPNDGTSTTGGIYLNGAVDSLRFRVTGGGHQAIDIEIAGEAWTATINRPANTTTLQKTAGAGSPSSTTWTGVTNGVIYTTEGISSVEGELADSYVSGSTILSRNAFTLATDILAGRNIVVTDNIRYATTPNANEAWNSTTNARAAYLGIMANEVQIASTAPQYLRIDALLVCGSAGASGKFWAPSYATTTPAGTVTVFGGVIANEAGYTATSTPTGWYDSYYYDPRMRVNPPPHFPTTGAYQRLSFKRTSAGAG